MIKRLLIANRGEIACRIIETAQRMGITSLAVYSEADRHARHVRMADQAYCIGPAAARDSYLNISALLTAAQTLQADAIHPGYGFLSENAEFARACQQAGLIFVGPSPEAISLMGDKAASLRTMTAAGVPVLPGFHQAAASDDALIQAAEQLGYPLLIKPVAGGGGKGMQCIQHAAELAVGIQKARREAASAFGNDALMLERFLPSARHIEVQIICDSHGQGLWLAERDCSMQRRNQKVLEEAPAPGLSDTQRRQLGQQSVKAALAIGYCGAGTLEFLFDPAQQAFYFMEMNTRLQVEHPVTEMITGLDLVSLQLQVASGAPLTLKQADIRSQGHAIEARICAEDPDQNFIPSAGCLMPLIFPPQSTHLRLDSGVEQGDHISPFYDSMIAKLICYDETREGAIERLHQALAHCCIGGPATNLSLLYSLTGLAEFRTQPLDTRYIEHHQTQLLLYTPPAHLLTAACAAQACQLQNSATSTFTRHCAWRLSGPASLNIHLEYDGQTLKRCLTPLTDNQWQIEAYDGHSAHIIRARLAHNQLILEADNQRSDWPCFFDTHGLMLFHAGRAWRFNTPQADYSARPGQHSGTICAPLSGILVELLVEAGQQVQADQPLAIMEAMKMEHTLRAPFAGRVESLYHAAGDQLSHNAELIQLTALEAPDETA